MSTDTFDYVIIGGGNAGLALAGRLTEDPSIHVCVLEAGQDVTSVPDIVVPGFSFKNMGNPAYDWFFTSAPQKHANDRKIHLLRGKGLGGSTILNFMEVSRGHSEEYNAFESLGSTGWNWSSFLQYFKKSETFTVNEAEEKSFNVKFDPSTDGTSGPLHRTMSKWIGHVHVPFQKTMESLGLPFNTNSNGGNNMGIWNANHSIHPEHATRSSSATAYYEPNKSRPNLTVKTGARVGRIIFFDPKNGEELLAQGAEYTENSVKVTVNARKEVIVCAGTFQTPQLLEVSGIGNKDILASHNIPCLLDLPAQNDDTISIPEDHFWCPYTAYMDEKYDSYEILKDPARAGAEWQLYEEKKTGMLATAASSIFAFMPPPAFVSNQDIIDTASKQPLGSTLSDKALAIQKSWLFGNAVPHLEFSPFPGFMPAPGKAAEEGKRYFSFFIALLHPFSRGSVHIGSSDLSTEPVIDLHMVDNAIDMELMVQAIKYARKVVRTEPLGGMLGDEVIPGSEIETDEEIKEYIRNTVQTVFHPVGTSAMLPRNEGGVVDVNLKVYGTKNLRVVDASVIPIQISAHTQWTVYALAEKAADIILGKIAA